MYFLLNSAFCISFHVIFAPLAFLQELNLGTIIGSDARIEYSYCGVATTHLFLPVPFERLLLSIPEILLTCDTLGLTVRKGGARGPVPIPVHYNFSGSSALKPVTPNLQWTEYDSFTNTKAIVVFHKFSTSSMKIYNCEIQCNSINALKLQHDLADFLKAIILVLQLSRLCKSVFA